MNLNLNTRTVTFSESTSPETPAGDSRPLNVEETLSFSAGFGTPLGIDLEGFSEYGVRENRTEDGTLESVDVIYEAMEPGAPEARNGVRITEEFLREVASKDYDSEPFMLGHSDQPLDEIGKLQKVWFDETIGKLVLMNRVFNTGAPTHDEVLSRLTHSPPTMTDGSVGFGDQYEAIMNEDDEPELVDGKIREFSTTPFPGGYDEGGLGIPNAAFSEAVTEATTVDDAGDADKPAENSASVTFSTETISL